MIEIQLVGSTGAYCGSYSYSHPRKDPVAPLLREMVKNGVCSEGDVVVVKRGDTVCFNPAAVKSWTDHTIMCQDKGGITKTKYVPFDRFSGEE